MTLQGSSDARYDGAPGPVDPLAQVRLRPLPLSAVTLADTGWWGRRQTLNREATLPYGMAMLESAGNIDNFRRVIGESDVAYRGFIFNDSDLYKTLEAVAWALGTEPDPELESYLKTSTDLLTRVQAADGYLNSYVQGGGGDRFVELAESHELYCAGHLLQAGVAHFRTTGERSLLDTATRCADQLVAEFGSGRRHDYDGHPEIETALVELYRATGQPAYLALSQQFVADRGARIFAQDRRGHAYFQDELPVRDATAIVGHAVRALYLEAGVVDVAVETGDEGLLASSVVRWQDMVGAKLYITGGVGSRHKSEAFGDPYELPPDRAYCETCAAIASIQWNWRLLLATGESRYADLLERTVFNGFAAGSGRDGTSFFYSNPLQVRENHQVSDEEESGRRLPWYGCACCPPNVMRLLASLHHYLATTDGGGVQIHQYTDGEIDLRSAGPGALLRVVTEYPWQGSVEVRVLESAPADWRLSLRVPEWCARAALSVNGEPVEAETSQGYLRIGRSWCAGDVVRLELEMPVRITAAHDKVDATRGCVAVERGPLVFCVEGADNPGIDLDAVLFDPAAPIELVRVDAWPEVIAIALRGSQTEPETGPLYHPARPDRPVQRQIGLTAIPYYLWANRAHGPMRVWLPSAASQPTATLNPNQERSTES